MKHRTNDDPAQASPSPEAGADDIEAEKLLNILDGSAFNRYGQTMYIVPEDMLIAVKTHIQDLLETERERVLDMVEAGLPSGEVDLVKFEKDKTSWIEEVEVDSETLTDKDMIAVWRLARHFKQQAINDTLKVIERLRK